MKLILSFILVNTVFAQFYGKIEESVEVSGHLDLIKEIELNHPELTIDHVSLDGFELYGPKGLKKWLNLIKVPFQETHSHHKSFDGYPSFKNLENFLMTIAAENPSIMKLISIGKSVEGRNLWVLKISDNVDEDELEPEFKYISSMHGNEITGRELTREFIKDIANGYGTNKRITRLVNSSEIFIMPSMNPDGSAKKQRENANGVDLNRNFPNWTAGDQNTTDGREPETVAMMKFQAQRNFALSANFHGGAVVVNYPWDSSYKRHPFDQFLQSISLVYANLNPQMKNSRSFKRGITNGADWYVLKGGMQDWSYIWHNDLQVTIELSRAKWPRYSAIPGFYKSNKDSMLAYAELIFQGVGVQSQGRGTFALYKNDKHLGTFKFKDEFYKVLPVGEYKFEVTSSRGKTSVPFTVSDSKSASINFFKL